VGEEGLAVGQGFVHVLRDQVEPADGDRSCLGSLGHPAAAFDQGSGLPGGETHHTFLDTIEAEKLVDSLAGQDVPAVHEILALIFRPVPIALLLKTVHSKMCMV
jgi:hypothetical protein